jgi:hypothetical protein
VIFCGWERGVILDKISNCREERIQNREYKSHKNTCDMCKRGICEKCIMVQINSVEYLMTDYVCQCDHKNCL